MKIGLLGYGVVGTGVCEIIDALNAEGDHDLEVEKIFVRPTRERTDPRMTSQMNDILINDQIDIVVECMGGLEPAYSYVKQALFAGKDVVTSNKAMMATYYQDLMDTAALLHRHLLFEASVGGGINWMHNIGISKRVDEIQEFRGILNGTTNYILDSMFTQGKDFADILKEAQALGYAEADPSSDIDGDDVRFKCCLTSNVIWNTSVDLNSIDTLGIRHLSKKDVDYCKAHNMVCRLIGNGVKKGDSYSVYVQPEFLSADDLLAHVTSNYNCGEILGKTCGKSYFMGQGAGKLPTANAVLQDCMSLVSKCRSRLSSLTKSNGERDGGSIDNKGVCASYYIRGNSIHVFSDWTAEQIDEDTILTKPVSIQDVVSRLKDLNNPQYFIAGVNV